MALVHLLPISDATTSLVVRLANLGLVVWVMRLSERLLRRIVPEAGRLAPALWISLALCFDLLYWGIHGFEATLLTAVFLLFLIRVHGDREEHPTTWFLLGLLPLIRSDAYALWIAGAVAAVARRGVRPALPGLACAAVLPLVHLGLRYAYYGDLLPNTYYLKVAGNGVGMRLGTGLKYLAVFGVFHWLYLLLAGLGARRGPSRALLLSMAVPIVYTLWVGGDVYLGARFLAPIVPPLAVLAFAAAHSFAGGNRSAERAWSASLALSGVVGSGFLWIAGSGHSLVRLRNGGPESSLVTALTIAKNAAPDAKVAVHAAGMVPYFSRRTSIDLLGKADAVVARLEPEGGRIGHNKLLPGYSLGQRAPDLVVMLWLPPGMSACNERDRASVGLVAPSWVASIYASEAFQQSYCGAALDVAGGDPIYFRRGSPEAVRSSAWAAVRTAP